MIRLLIVSAIAGVVILALVGVALRRQARRAARASYVWPAIPLPGYALPAPAEIEAPGWWAIGALSDVRRRAADREGLAEFGVSVPLADAYIWEALNTEWASRQVELAPVGWAPRTGHAVTLPADALGYDRYVDSGVLAWTP